MYLYYRSYFNSYLKNNMQLVWFQTWCSSIAWNSLILKEPDIFILIVLVVTGSTHGIGRAFAEQLASRGLNILIVSININDCTLVSGDLGSPYHMKLLFTCLFATILLKSPQVSKSTRWHRFAIHFLIVFVFVRFLSRSRNVTWVGFYI